MRRKHRFAATDPRDTNTLLLDREVKHNHMILPKAE